MAKIDNSSQRINPYAFLHGTLGGFAPAKDQDPTRRAWAEDEDRELASLWPIWRTKAIAKRLNRSPEAVRIRARVLNL